MKIKNTLKASIFQSKLFWCAVLALLAIAALALVCTFFEFAPLIAALIVAAVYAVAVVLVIIFVKEGDSGDDESEISAPALSNVMLTAVQKLHSPVFIADEAKERIIWHNKATSSLLDSHSAQVGTKLRDIFDFQGSGSISAAAADGKILRTGDRSFRASVTGIRTSARQFELFELTEITDIENLYSEIARKNIIVSYVIVDNLSDMLQNQQQMYRDASSKIQDILSEWAKENDGVIKEYDRNHYVFFFEAEKLDEMVVRKFDILDKIRDVRIGDSGTPVTISMGVANLKDASPEKKEKVAEEALDMALQRGGDQVVVKGEDSIEFYGGRSKTVQKRTKVRARVIANELISRMSSSSNVIIMAHRYPDFDAFGSAVGLARLAMFCGVRVNIVYDEARSADVKMCRAMLTGDEYRGVFVDSEAALDLVRSDTLLILTDVNNISLVEAPDIAESCASNMIIIDHHRKTAEFATQPLLTYIEPSASSASELVAEMLEQVLPPSMIPVTEANMLLSGILLDTKQFTKNTGTRTFSAALYLRDRGADPNEAQKFFKIGIDDFKREGRFRSNVVVYRDITAIVLGDGEGTPEDRVAAAKTADKLLSVDGVEASFALVKIGDTVHISARSAGIVNVQLILEELRGGGHFDSAGAQVTGSTMQEALLELKAAIDHYIDGIADAAGEKDK